MRVTDKKVNLQHSDDSLPKALEAGEMLKQKKLTALQYQDMIDMKAQKKKWESKHRVLFLAIGLCVSLLLVNIAFSWRSAEQAGILTLSGDVPNENELLDIPVSSQPPPPPPKKTVDLFVIKEVDEEIIEELKVTVDVEVNADSEITELVFEDNEPEEEVDEIFTIVETKPTPVGGMKAFYGFVAENLKYPKPALQLGLSGRVFIEFVVEKDGKLTDLHVVRGIGGGCDEEAVRVLSKAPNWNPGKQRGRLVRVRMILPIHFKLHDQ